VRRRNSKIPATNAPDAQILSKNRVKGFEILDTWIGLHIDNDTGMPLAFAIRTIEADASLFLSQIDALGTYISLR
jgi:hypothetical protein